MEATMRIHAYERANGRRWRRRAHRLNRYVQNIVKNGICGLSSGCGWTPKWSRATEVKSSNRVLLGIGCCIDSWWLWYLSRRRSTSRHLFSIFMCTSNVHHRYINMCIGSASCQIITLSGTYCALAHCCCLHEQLQRWWYEGIPYNLYL